MPECAKQGDHKDYTCYRCLSQRPGWCKLCQRTPCNPGYHAHKLHRIRMRYWEKKQVLNFCSLCGGECDAVKHKLRWAVELVRRHKRVKTRPGYAEVYQPAELDNCDYEQEIALALLEGSEITWDEARRRANRGRNYAVSLESTADWFGNTAADRSE